MQQVNFVLLQKILLCTNKTLYLEKTFLFGTTAIEMYFGVLLKRQQLRSMTDRLAFLELTLPCVTYFCH